jgi:asparagine synthase (glutamine-hydrolysing)
MERLKMGFGIPIVYWLQIPLCDWTEVLLDEKRLWEEGVFNLDLIRKMWQEIGNGKCRWYYNLWDVLMFQAWLEGKV